MSGALGCASRLGRWRVGRTPVLRMCFAAILNVCALNMMACRSSYPAPSPRTLAPSNPLQTADRNRGDTEALHAMERQCRARLEHDTASASLTALDRVHEVLGSSCDVSTVDRDPLHWVLHCRSDALFDSGEYALADKSKVACRELGNAQVNQWQCVGAVFQDLFARGGAIESLSAAVIGHVDMQPLNPGSSSHVCTELMTTLGYERTVPWTAVAAGATDEERQYANQQLAFCRAASVGDQLRQGMTRKAAPGATSELAVVGAGSSWLRSRVDGKCPTHGKSWQERSDCMDARRVDLLVRFTPKAERTQAPCDADRNDPSGALYCLEQCLESAAVGSHAGSGMTTAAVPLFVPAHGAPTSLPSGFYLHRIGAQADRRLDLSLVCDTLGIDRATCGQPR